MKTSIVFFSSTDFGAEILKVLVDNQFDILAVVTRTDKRKGRGKKLQMTPVKEVAIEQGLSVLEFDSIDATVEKKLTELKPDFFVLVAYGALISKDVLNIPKIAPLNIHASLLPYLRGASPIESAIKLNYQETGISFMRMNERLDEGDVYKKIPLQIDDDETFDSLNVKLLEIAKENIVDTIEAISNGLVASPQVGESSYAGKIEKGDEIIDFRKSAVEVKNLINSLDSHIGATAFKDDMRYKLYGAKLSNLKLEPAEILVDKNMLYIGTGTNAVNISYIQQQGKKKMDIKSFLLGNDIEGEFNIEK